MIEKFPLSFVNGELFVDDYFILVDGNENGVDAGYGTYEKDHDSISLFFLLV